MKSTDVAAEITYLAEITSSAGRKISRPGRRIFRPFLVLAEIFFGRPKCFVRKYFVRKYIRPNYFWRESIGRGFSTSGRKFQPRFSLYLERGWNFFRPAEKFFGLAEVCLSYIQTHLAQKKSINVWKLDIMRWIRIRDNNFACKNVNECIVFHLTGMIW